MQKKSRLFGWMTVPAPSVSRLQRQWLTQPGALTQGLRTLGVLTLRVLSEKVCRASPDEATRLGLPTGHALWQREVCMSILGMDCVVARSVTPLEAVHGHWQAVRRLRNRPLADILYHDRAIVRSGFEFTTLRIGMPLHLISQIAPTSDQRFLARRSVFVRAGQPLLVAEAFLPAFWGIAK
jgi:chorismate--pyruvate lyase